MKTIVRVLFGSQLYGTSTPESDTDYKSVHLPDQSDIVLQRAKGVIATNTKTDPTRKNEAGDVDDESFALHKYLGLVASGDMMATELLFAPESSWVKMTPDWARIINAKPHIINSRCDGFIGYCRKQAAKYGIKGSRVKTARDALLLLDCHDASDRIGDLETTIAEFISSHEHTGLVDIPSKGTIGILRHWEVCGRKLPFTVRIGEARSIVQKMVDNFGSRSLAAELNQGVDWKSLSHAVRVAQQSIELLQTAQITFPRPNAPELLDIKRGKVPYTEVAERLENLLDEIETVSAASSLPEQSNSMEIDYLVYQLYHEQILSNRSGCRTEAMSIHAPPLSRSTTPNLF